MAVLVKYIRDLRKSAELLFNVDAIHTEKYLLDYIDELRRICQRLFATDTAEPRRSVSTRKLWQFYHDIQRLRAMVEPAEEPCTSKKTETAVAK